MQQQESQRTTLLLVACFVIFMGWFYVEQLIWPRKPVPKPEPTAAQVIHRDAAMIVAGPGIVGDPRVVKMTGDPIEGLTPKKPEPKKEPEPIVQEPTELIPLGFDAEKPFFVRVLLCKRGAGVQQVVLTRFQAGDREGLPMVEADGTKRPLEIIPGYVQPRAPTMKQDYIPNPLSPGVSPKDVVLTEPSYVMFHYDKPDDDRPMNTLRNVEWNIVKQDNKAGSDEQSVVFETELKEPHNVKIRKTFTLKRGDYHVGLRIEVERLKDQKGNRFRYQIDGAHAMPIEGEWYTSTYRNMMTGWASPDGGSTRYMEDASTIHFKGGSDRLLRSDRILRYTAVTTQFFASAIVVDTEQPDKKQNFVEFVRATPEGPSIPNRTMLDDITVRAISEEMPLDAATTHQYVLYQGPIKVRLLWQMDNADGTPAVAPELVAKYHDQLNLKTLTDYQMPGPIGSFASFIFWTDLLIASTNLMHWILGGFSTFIPSMGLCIVCLTILVRGFLFPISRRQAANGVRMQEKMAKVQPELKKIKEKYGDDPQALRQAQMQLYVKHGINPLAMMGGCLLLIMQMPIFMGLYYALQESIIFRLQPFLWFPNLAAPDMLVRWGESIPFISLPNDFGSMFYLGPYLNIMPILAVTLMTIQQRMMMPPPADEQQAMQQSMMKWMMILFGFFFYKVAAGLCLYFIVSTIWALVERKFLPKKKPLTNTPITVDAKVVDHKTSNSPPPPAPVAQRDRKALMKNKNDRKPTKGQPKVQEPQPKKDEVPTTMRGKLKAWWQDVLEKARKK